MSSYRPDPYERDIPAMIKGFKKEKNLTLASISAGTAAAVVALAVMFNGIQNDLVQAPAANRDRVTAGFENMASELNRPQAQKSQARQLYLSANTHLVEKIFGDVRANILNKQAGIKAALTTIETYRPSRGLAEATAFRDVFQKMIAPNAQNLNLHAKLQLLETFEENAGVLAHNGKQIERDYASPQSPVGYVMKYFFDTMPGQVVDAFAFINDLGEQTWRKTGPITTGILNQYQTMTPPGRSRPGALRL